MGCRRISALAPGAPSSYLDVSPTCPHSSLWMKLCTLLPSFLNSGIQRHYFGDGFGQGQVHPGAHWHDLVGHGGSFWQHFTKSTPVAPCYQIHRNKTRPNVISLTHCCTPSYHVFVKRYTAKHLNWVGTHFNISIMQTSNYSSCFLTS